MRLIDADRLISVSKEIMAIEWNKKVAPLSWAEAEEEFIDRLEAVPTIDAVEVVRCGECKWCCSGYCKRYDDVIPFGYANREWEDWYCADGERKGVSE